MTSSIGHAIGLATHDAAAAGVAAHASDSIVSIFTDAVKTFGERNAFMFKEGAAGEWQHMTFAQAGKRVENIGEGLAQMGIGKDNRVAILANSRVEWGLVDYAAMGNGSVVVPIYQTNSADEVLKVLLNSKADSIVVEDALQLAKVEQIRSQVPSLKNVIVMDPSAETATARALAAVERDGAAVTTGGWRERAVSVKREDLATIIYTSGTTGDPKGVLLTHGNYTAVVDALAGAENLLRPEDRVVLFLPLAHTFARSINFAAARTGMEIAYSAPKTILEDLKAIQPTILPSVPRIFEKANAGIVEKLAEQTGIKGKLARRGVETGARYYAAVQSGKGAGILLRAENALAERFILPKVRTQVSESFGGRIRVAFSGGAPLDRGIQSRFGALDMPIYDAYGLSESPAVSANLPGASRLGTVGKPLAGIETKLGPDSELWVRGPAVFKGYNDNAKATAETLDAEGWLHTGDQVSISKDGFITITGRIKDLMKTSGGEYLQPSGFETAMKGNPIVSNAVLFGDQRNFPSALVTLNEAEAKNLAPAASTSEEFANDTKVQQAVQDAISNYNTTVSDAKKVKKFRILIGDLSQETGEITPSLKVKRKVVTERFQAQVDDMYKPDAPDVGVITRPA